MADKSKPDRSERKQPGHLYKPGQSGNPAGCPTGARWRTTKLLDAIGAENAEKVLQATILKAIKGDATAQEVILRRVWPAPKGKPVRIDGMPRIVNPADVRAALVVIADAMAQGELTPDEATMAAGVVDVQRRSFEKAKEDGDSTVTVRVVGGRPLLEKPDASDV